MKLISWNVNGLRACIKKGFFDFVNEASPDIIALQETKMHPSQFEADAGEYTIYWNSAEKKGYSGTAIFVKNQLKTSPTESEFRNTTTKAASLPWSIPISSL